jgi:transposase
MRKTQEIVRLLLQEERSIREIAQSCGVPRSTVSDYVQRVQASGLTWAEAAAQGEPELRRRLFPARNAEKRAYDVPDFAEMRTELSKKGVTLQLLWEEYRRDQPGGYGYSQYCKLYAEWAGKCDPVMRQEHKAGEKLFVDFSGKTMPIVDAVTGEVKLNAQIFVAVLGASNYTFALATPSQKVDDWLDAHVKCFRFLNGVTEIVVPDNLKSGVRSPDRYEPDLNPSYQDLATHYGCAVIPARVRKPRDKASVEVGVQIVQRWVLSALRKRTFYSMGELNEAIAVLVDVLNRRPFKKLPGNRYTRFLELDQPALRPLPAKDYEMAEWKRATVNIDYHIELDKHRYSVPYQLVGESVDVRYTNWTVEILHMGGRVAAHKRSYRVGGFSTQEGHRPKAHQKTEWTPSRLIEWGCKIGPQTGAFVGRLLMVRPHPEQGFRSALALLKLAKEFSPERLEAACKMGLDMNVASARVIKNILQAGRDRAQPEQTELNLPQDHENIRGGGSYN